MNEEKNKELKNLVDSFSKLSTEEQVDEIEKELKTLIAIINSLNKSELSLVSATPYDNGGTNLVQVYSLICSLEEEIGLLMLKE